MTYQGNIAMCLTLTPQQSQLALHHLLKNVITRSLHDGFFKTYQAFLNQHAVVSVHDLLQLNTSMFETGTFFNHPDGVSIPQYQFNMPLDLKRPTIGLLHL